MTHQETKPRRTATGWNHARTILVPTDFSPRTHNAFAYALSLARQVEAEVQLMHVIGPLEGEAYSPLRYTPEAAALQHTPQKTIYDLLAGILAHHDTTGVAVELVKQRGMKPAKAILDFARREAIDLIVIGTHGAHSIRRLWLGSVAEEIVRRAPCNVLVVHERDDAETSPRAIKRVLAPVDFSTTSQTVLGHARLLAATQGAEIDLLHVIETPSFLKPITGLATLGDLVPDAEAQAQTYLARLRDEAAVPPVPIRTHLEAGSPAARIVRVAHQHNADLIVMATHGASGMKRFFLGSVTERVVRTAPCPVLCVKVDERAAPDLVQHAVPKAEETL